MKLMVNQLSCVVVLAVIAWFGGGTLNQAMAASITYAFDGTVTNADAPVAFDGLPGGDMRPGSQLSGLMTVNTTNNFPSGNIGSYNIQSLQITIGTYHLTMGLSTAMVFIGSDPVIGSSFEMDVPFPLGRPMNFQWIPSNFSFGLISPQNVFSSTALPGPSELPPSLNAFSIQRSWALTFFGPGPVQQVTGNLTSLTAVPLPGSVVLFGVGIVTLVGLGAGRLRNRLFQA